MNAVEIEEAISVLAERSFDADEFPYAFLEAFGNKETTLKRLRKGESNKSDLGGVLQTNNIHIATCNPGHVTRTLEALKKSPATARAKARFVLATDGDLFEAEDLTTDDAPISCTFTDFPNHFGFFLPLAGITTVKQVRESSFDIRATSRLNRLYVELLKDNPEWGAAHRRHDMNHFMARLIFCFFAEDTEIFDSGATFTSAIETMSAKDSLNTHEVISELFRAMNTRAEAHAATGVPRWASRFPYVNGGLFSGSTDVPRFSRIARSYLLHIGSLDWKKINPDIFGSMIQAVADDEERGALGMHYTSVPNILKVLNPLFLDDLREKLHEAGDNARMLLNLRKRMSKIRVFDPACGSGNFLVIAYKEIRAIEAEINRRRDEPDQRTEIPLTNFRGIELRDFPAEIARLALIIAEYQCDVLYRGQKEALRDFLPLDAQNWITCGNSLRLDWLSICPPTGKGVRHQSDDLFESPVKQAEIEFENEGGETYLCANPPYQGSVNQTTLQKEDMARIFSSIFPKYKDLDYVAAFMIKAAQFNRLTGSASAFVTTNSITQGEQVGMLWPLIFGEGNVINFAHKSFLWSNLASNKAAVTCIIVGLSTIRPNLSKLFSADMVQEVPIVGPYLVSGSQNIVVKRNVPLHPLSRMDYGNKPTDGGNLILSPEERALLLSEAPESQEWIREYIGSQEFIRGTRRYCLWIEDDHLSAARAIPSINRRIEKVRQLRSESRGQQANQNARTSHRFVFSPHTNGVSIVVPRHFSERREYITAGILNGEVQVIADSASAIYDANLVDFAVISSKLHMVWVDTVAGRIKTDYRYSSTLVWNTFPVPALTEKNRADLTRCAEDILLAREAHFPAAISELYDPEAMPGDLRAAHDRNDEMLERIYIGRRFKNDTERLEKLFELYTKMSTTQGTRLKAGARA
ncbi:class I SAM-dependent DNA methyltransferase [Agrobacterium rubi]|uniref:site-specific DNA-methyltransferase (adenine-specific) n=1 Tax=Agrobacterium rubi TaxID=28099 RepID=A0AAE7RDZ0_9HYPH|nr:DNA methyltransferase [Agrobacterium rubi]NTE90092.1 class I SAM-dependent DNA methyltransferase [Agrobacterium rubi]NTF05947.1 class I SAM-dependent DNA methyltransferase [Agrobacterium rubi]NTF39451.1 class I SAM-dependent DNA methyltransferase [Agrobacterium rubi]OCJ51774.1 lactate dehydrogenase [Agrobacterium rubi]QTG03907.1 class I SAM-dependent DNA methyltransferase [Agrobacterium rubi]